MTSENKLNRLAFEKSPYLLQHADNPVDWYPWGEEAFEKARTENKPIFLSIGYSTCHWCHVMAHESFEDSTIARLMNDVLVSIKVDREERPDIDILYMTVCQMMTGSGGWPLSIIMTPDKQPFFSATYIPRETRFGRVGMLELVSRIKQIWATRKDEVLSSANQIAGALQKVTLLEAGEELSEEMLHLGYRQLKDKFDEEYGGFGGAPKFPTPHNLLFLLRYWKRTRNNEALDMVERTLQAMRCGGVYDHIGFGFHRYSTDRLWLVPHFEKMLYDQALLAMAYVEAFQATGKDEYARTAREVFSYVLRDMSSSNGGFYSAEDADSEGQEGKFYLWTHSEIRRILPADDADFIIKLFNITEAGNFRGELGESKTGRNTPYLARPWEEAASEPKMPVAELEKRIESIRQELFAYREERVHPHKDDKVLTDWNGLMVAAFAKGARILEEPAYAIAAERAVRFIFDNMLTADGCLLHRYRDGEAAVSAILDDYAFLIYGMMELYETTFKAGYLDESLKLNEYLLKHFWDNENGGFYFTADNGEALLIRQKEIYDGAIPSGNSIAMLNLLRLGRITGNVDLEEKAARIGRAFFEKVRQSPSAHTQLMIAVDFAVGPSYEVVIIGDTEADDTRKMLRAVQKTYIPNKILILVPEGTARTSITKIAPFTKEQSRVNGKATCFVCINHRCKLPTTDIDTMLSLLDSS